MFRENAKRVLQLQRDYSPSKSSAMDERAKIVKEGLPQDLGALLESKIPQGDWKIKGSAGIGYNAQVPWVRIYNPAQSPRPTAGWYVVFLFSLSGKFVSLSLNLGVTGLKSAEVTKLRNFGLDRLTEKHNLEEMAETLNANFTIDLDSKGSQLSELYERGHVVGFTYDLDDLPSDERLAGDLAWLLTLLESLPNQSSSEDQAGRPGQMGGDELEALIAETGWTKSLTADILESIFDKSPQIVFTGPPGTGKTHSAMCLAKYIVSDNMGDWRKRITTVQFHPSYGYEDFVEGLRPAPNEKGNMEFQRVAGIILQIADQISQDGLSRVLIIDEMNRANLPRVFGELMYLLEYRDREIDLMYHGKFTLPRQLFVIGTMNTADRSTKNLDIALRRRFDFFEIAPDVEILRRHFKERTNKLGEDLFVGFESLNAKIREQMLDRHHSVGHSFFMTESMDKPTLERIWRLQIEPLIEDYFFDRVDPLQHFPFNSFWK